MSRNGQPYFHFQKFSIWQDRCAMKVGVDGILLGAWVRIQAEHRLLDIGTGTGLIALMLAQRHSSAKIVGIDIDTAASLQARENVTRSPWSDRIEIRNIAYQELQSHHPYDLVICNPPYFDNKDQVSPRAIARSQRHLSPTEMVQTISPHLTEAGRLAMIIPIDQADALIETAIASQLFPTRRTNVRPTPTSKLKRALIEFSRLKKTCIENEIVLEKARHQYTPEYQHLVQNFLLKFSHSSKTEINPKN